MDQYLSKLVVFVFYVQKYKLLVIADLRVNLFLCCHNLEINIKIKSHKINFKLLMFLCYCFCKHVFLQTLASQQK